MRPTLPHGRRRRAAGLLLALLAAAGCSVTPSDEPAAISAQPTSQSARVGNDGRWRLANITFSVGSNLLDELAALRQSRSLR